MHLKTKKKIHLTTVQAPSLIKLLVTAKFITNITAAPPKSIGFFPYKVCIYHKNGYLNAYNLFYFNPTHQAWAHCARGRFFLFVVGASGILRK